MRKNFGAKPWTYPQPVFILGSYDENGKANAMNAAWGGISDTYELSLCISAGHKTTKNILARKAFTVSMADVAHMAACDYVGIVSGNDALLEGVKPMLVEHGWLEAGPVDEQAARAEDDPEADGPDASSERMDIVSPLRDWTVTERISLLRTLYGRQYLLNRMMQGETLCIEETFVTAMTDDPPSSVADFEARVRDGIEAGAVRGVAFEGGKFIFGTPCRPEEAARWTAYCELLDGVLRSAKAAKRVSITPHVDPESEKYRANSWLVRMGFAGTAHKELRHTLTAHLNGYAAFKSAAGMQAHREKYAAIRRRQREAARTKDEIESREASE